MLYIGIDPGAKGAIAVVDDLGQPFEDWNLCHAKSTPLEQFRYLISLMAQAQMNGCKAMIEKVGAMPKQGVSSTFKFGWNAGLSEGLLIGSGIPYEFARPVQWQRNVGIQTIKGASSTEKKNSHKRCAQRLWPKLTGLTHDNCDALLIAEACRRINSQNLHD